MKKIKSQVSVGGNLMEKRMNKEKWRNHFLRKLWKTRLRPKILADLEDKRLRISIDHWSEQLDQGTFEKPVKLVKFEKPVRRYHFSGFEKWVWCGLFSVVFFVLMRHAIEIFPFDIFRFASIEEETDILLSGSIDSFDPPYKPSGFGKPDLVIGSQPGDINAGQIAFGDCDWQVIIVGKQINYQTICAIPIDKIKPLLYAFLVSQRVDTETTNSMWMENENNDGKTIAIHGAGAVYAGVN